VFAGLALLLGSAAFIAVLVIARNRTLELPAPGGPYRVGRSELDWVDTRREDALADTPGRKRELAVWIWYPAQAGAAARPAPYFPPAWARAREADQGIGMLIESEPDRIVTHSYAGVPLAAAGAPYPVLVMQPGMGPAIPDYSVLAENLASHGYIVVGANTSDTSNLVVFPDGRIVYRSKNGTIPDSAGPAAIDGIGNRIMEVWRQDVIFVMDRLQDLNSDPASPFYRRLDLEHSGVFGHSFGGATAIAVCQQEPRCKAGADLDGTPFSAEAQAPLPAPFLFITEDYSEGCDPNCAAIRKMTAGRQPAFMDPSAGVYNLSVKGAGHFNFSDLPLRLVPAARLLLRIAGYTGAIDPARGEQISNAYLLAFFDQSLKGIASPLLDGPAADYPEVQFVR
jgi:predicted dienelactone hydrolase